MSKLIYVVEDDEAIRTTITLVLEMQGYRIECFTNGKLALDALDTKEEKPNLILLDLRMPVMDGHQFIEIYFNERDFPNIPILVMSADRQAEEPLLAGKKVQFIKKPMELDNLLSSIKELV